MSYPCLMYRSPGPHKLPGKNGATYGYVGVNDETEEQSVIAKGYVRSRAEAISGKVGHIDPMDGLPSDIQLLRSAYEEKFGKRPFMGWDAKKLTEMLEGKPDE